MTWFKYLKDSFSTYGKKKKNRMSLGQRESREALAIAWVRSDDRPHNLAIPLLEIDPKELKVGFWTCMFIAKRWKQPKCPLIDKQIKKMWYVCSGILPSLNKKENPVKYYNMGGPWGHSVKWHKPVTKWQIVLWFHYCEICDIVILWETESSMVIKRLGAGGRGVV